MPIRRWFRYRWLRMVVRVKNYLTSLRNTIDDEKIYEMDDIQKLVYSITLKLIHDPESELRSSQLDYTYHVENDNYLIIIRHHPGNYSINLIEYKTRELINNFDVSFFRDDMDIIIDNFDREIHKRMNARQLLKTTKVVRHLQSILDDITSKQKILYK